MKLPIGEAEQLDAAAEIRLARQIEAGVFAAQALATGARPCGASEAELEALVRLGEDAYREFFLANLKMVALLAHQWSQRARLDREDLFQEGCLGLAQALMRWDHTRGVRFGTLAWRLIDTTMAGAALVRCGEVEASHARARAAFETRRELGRLEFQLGRSVGVHELAGHLGIDVRVVSSYLAVGRAREQLDERVADTVEDDPVPGTEVLPEGLLDDLPADYRMVLRARYGLGQAACTQAQLASRLGVSTSSVRRLEARALSAARRRLEAALVVA